MSDSPAHYKPPATQDGEYSNVTRYTISVHTACKPLAQVGALDISLATRCGVRSGRIPGAGRILLARETSTADSAAGQANNRTRRARVVRIERRRNPGSAARRPGFRFTQSGLLTSMAPSFSRMVATKRVRLARRRRPFPHLRREDLGATSATKAAPQAVPPTAKGRTRSRLPVAANTALATAGPIGATPGSPTPVGASDDDTICTSTFGISSMRST
jgi:hypothetical protein